MLFCTRCHNRHGKFDDNGVFRSCPDCGPALIVPQGIVSSSLLEKLAALEEDRFFQGGESFAKVGDRFSFDPGCTMVYFETADYHRTWSWPWGGVVTF